MKTKLLLIVSIIILIFINSCSKNELKGYKEYTNDEYGFSIFYPTDWNYREGFGRDSKTSTGAIVVFQDSLESKGDLFRENTYIFTESLPDSVTNVDEYLKYSKSSLPSQMKEFKVLDDGETIINERKSDWVIFSYVSRLQRVQSLAYLFIVDGKGFVITSTSRPEDFMRFRRTFENIAKSIKFE